MDILLIEDDPTVRLALQRLLNQAGHNVIWSATGHGGVRLLYTEKVDVLILDMNLGMNSISGWDVARIRHTDPELRKIPLIIISGLPPEEIAVSKVDTLADARILGKPVSLDDLNAALEYTQTSKP